MTQGRIRHHNEATMQNRAFAHTENLLSGAVMAFLLIGCQPAPSPSGIPTSVAPPTATPSVTAAEGESQPTAAATLVVTTAPHEVTSPCSDPQPALITDFTIRPQPVLAEPAPRVPFRD